IYARYGRTLTINGDIELSLFPRIGLAVQDVTLSDRGSSDLFASMDSARLAVAIWPLMFNRLVVDHVAVNGLQAWITRDEGGDYNFQDLLSRHQLSRLPGPDLPSPLAVLSGGLGTAQAVVTAVAGTPASAAEPEPVGESALGRTMRPGGGTDLQIDIAGLTLRNGRINL